MSRIEVAPRIRCDRCGEAMGEESHHARAVFREGFGDLRNAGHVCLVMDLCDACMREVRAFADTRQAPLGL